MKIKLIFLILCNLIIFPLISYSQDIDDAKEVVEKVNKLRDGDVGKVGKGLLQRSFFIGIRAAEKTIEVNKGKEKGGMGILKSTFTADPVVSLSIPASASYSSFRIPYIIHSEVTPYNLTKQSIKITNRCRQAAGCYYKDRQYQDNEAYLDEEGNEETTSELLDVGTGVTGIAYSITPIFYLQGDSDLGGILKSNGILYFGAGIGVGYLDVKGETYLTTNSDNPACETSAFGLNVEGIKTNCKKKLYFRKGLCRIREGNDWFFT
jgi:hypothetical protein